MNLREKFATGWMILFLLIALVAIGDIYIRLVDILGWKWPTLGLVAMLITCWAAYVWEQIA